MNWKIWMRKSVTWVKNLIMILRFSNPRNVRNKKFSKSNTEKKTVKCIIHTLDQAEERITEIQENIILRQWKRRENSMNSAFKNSRT
jgi:hypothetical protein